MLLRPFRRSPLVVSKLNDQRCRAEHASWEAKPLKTRRDGSNGEGPSTMAKATAFG